MTEPTPDASSEVEDIRRVVAAYVAAGADESVQRVITAVNRLSRRLNRWYDRQLAALGINLRRVDRARATGPNAG